MRRALTISCLLLGAFALPACTGGSGGGRQATARQVVPQRFVRLSGMLRRGRAAAQAGDVAALRALREPLSKEGLGLLQARIPNDLRRQDMPRFLSARRQFGETLSRWVAAIEAGDNARTLTAFRELDDATQGWIDAYLGQATETAI